MPDNPRIEDLRRRVQKDPASIAFAQLAEEYRRAGQCKESVEVCRAGLALHPGYLSARVTLGRALVELGQLEEAQHELETVLKSALENLAAIRGLAEIHHRRGALEEALRYYRAALTLARNDPELEETVKDLERKVEPPPPVADEGLSLEQMKRELAARVPPVAKPAAAAAAPEPAVPQQSTAEDAKEETMNVSHPHPERDRAVRTIAALEEWLDAVHVARADRRS
jgi:tetratricopeptide (TPR) repeat protein